MCGIVKHSGALPRGNQTYVAVYIMVSYANKFPWKKITLSFYWGLQNITSISLWDMEPGLLKKDI